MVVQIMKENCPLFDMQATVQEIVGSVLPGKSTNTSRICYYLDRYISYLNELQLRRNFAYEILCRLSPTKK
jgi:hypothetical protein